MDPRPVIDRVVVVEGRDDTSAVLRAADCVTAETHGFGITADTWEKLDALNKRCGLIIFTDPDFSGNEIRKKLTARFPDALQAYLTVESASRDGDIGIENASPEDIRAALLKCCERGNNKTACFTSEDLAVFSGREGSSELRQKLGKELGIGGGNASAFLKKLNALGISREEFEEACRKIL